MPEHTPGPWVYVGRGQIVTEDNGEYITRVALTDVSGRAEANATLIAAAPDLLSAAKAAVEWMDAMPLEVDVLLPSEYSERLADIYESFRAAIEKAGAK